MWVGLLDRSLGVGRKQPYPVQLHAKIPDQIGVLDALEYLQLVRGFLDGFMVIRLESTL